MASRKDGGFGRADLAWALSQMNVASAATRDRYDGPGLALFAKVLQERLLRPS